MNGSGLVSPLPGSYASEAGTGEALEDGDSRGGGVGYWATRDGLDKLEVRGTRLSTSPQMLPGRGNVPRGT